MAFEVTDRDPGPALRGADQGREHETHRRILIQQSGTLSNTKTPRYQQVA